MHTNERVAVPERGPVNLRELQRLGSAVPVLDDRLHRDLLIWVGSVNDGGHATHRGREVRS
jgi:hypothetical protein